MTIKEQTKKQIEVMQAYLDNKTIECKDKHANVWKETKNPGWNWYTLDYRIKPEPTYRPYANLNEFLQAQKEHGPNIIYLSGHTYLPVEASDRKVWFWDNEGVLFEDLIEFNWQDGTPCRVLTDNNE